MAVLPPVPAAWIGHPTAHAATAEGIHEIGSERGMLRNEHAQLQFQIESPRGALPRQAMLLRQIADLSGIPLTR